MELIREICTHTNSYAWGAVLDKSYYGDRHGELNCIYYRIFLCPYAYDCIPSFNMCRLSSKQDNDTLLSS